MKLNIKKLVEDAQLPIYGSQYAIGMDVFSKEDYSVPPRTRKLVGTGIYISWHSKLRLDDDTNELFYLYSYY